MAKSTALRLAVLAPAFMHVIALGFSEAPDICMISPNVEVTAGQTLMASVQAYNDKLCEATIVFADPDFLPVHFGLEPATCPESQVATITIPLESADGDAFILWDCAGPNPGSCMQVSISGGTNDPDNILLDQFGVVNCTVPNASNLASATSSGAGSATRSVAGQTIISSPTSFVSIPAVKFTTVTISSSSSTPVPSLGNTESPTSNSSSTPVPSLGNTESPTSSSLSLARATPLTQTSLSTSEHTDHWATSVKTSQCSCTSDIQEVSATAGLFI